MKRILAVAIGLLVSGSPILCFADGGAVYPGVAKQAEHTNSENANKTTAAKPHLPSPWSAKTIPEDKLPKPQLTKADLKPHKLAKPTIIKTTALQKALPPQLPNQVSKSWFIKPSIGVMRVNLPKFQYGTVSNIQTTPVFNFRTSFSKYVPGIEVGRYFNNNRFLPAIFGNTTSLSFAIYHIKNEQARFVGNDINVFLWGIDGKGSLTPISDNSILNSNIFKQRQVLSVINILFKGHKTSYHSNNVITRSTSIGFIYRRFTQAFNIDSLQSPAEFPVFLNEKTKTQYYGFQVRNKVTFRLNQNIAPFVAGYVSGLYVNTNFNGEQGYIINSNFSKTIVVRNGDNRISYILGLIAGIHLHPSALPIIITLKGGAEYLDYMPEIINPDSENSRPAHVVGQSEVNPFGEISVTVPF